MKRGVLSIVWGTKSDAVLPRCRASVAKWHPELEHEVIRLEDEGPQTLLRKSEMNDLSPFDQTLFVDADAMLLGRVDLAFEKAEKYGLACAISQSPWIRRYQGVELPMDEVEYNTGLVAWDKNHRSPQFHADPFDDVPAFFEAWKRHAEAIDSSIVWVTDDRGTIGRMVANDQGSFTAALLEVGLNPYVLPLNYNLMPAYQRTWYGPAMVWHAYVDPPPALLAWNDYYSRPDSIIQPHDLDRLAPPKMDLLYMQEKS